MASSIFKRMNVDNCLYYKTTYFFLLADYFRVKLFLKFVSYNIKNIQKACMLLQSMETWILYYLAIINAITFIVYGIDKLKAKNGKWRIPETTLLLLAIIGGSIGAWFGMKVWHHKTMHKKFKYGIPLIIILQLGVLLYLSKATQQ